jgi:hypothetical protein
LALKRLKSKNQQTSRRKQNENQQGRDVATPLLSDLSIAGNGAYTLPDLDAPARSKFGQQIHRISDRPIPRKAGLRT